MWIVEKNREKSPDALCIRALFFCGEEGGFGAMAFRNCRRAASPSVKSLWEGGRGRTFLKKGPPPVFTHPLLIQALLDHGVGHLTEAGDVAAEDVVAGHAEFLGGFMGGLEDVGHDVLELGVDFFKGPGLHTGVLSHFELAGGHAARVGALAGPEGEPA